MAASTNRLFVGILLLAGVAGVSLPGAAHADTHRFVAALAAEPATPELISSEMRWTCEGAACAAQGPMLDAPARICSRLARERGRIDSFAVNGVGFSVEQMERCNAKAVARRPAADLSTAAR